MSLTNLAKNLQDASKFTVTKPDISLQRSRLVLEEILYESYKLEMHTEPKLKSIRTLMNNRSFIAKIHPRRIYLLMNLVRKMTISSSGIIEAKAAKIVLDYISDIVEWFINRYDRSFIASLSVRKGSLLEDVLPPFDMNILHQEDQPTDDYEYAANWFELAANEAMPVHNII